MDHTTAAARAGSKSAKRKLRAAEVPVWMELVWSWYWDLRSSSPEGFSSTRISYQELAAWIAVECVHPTVWQVRMIRALDVVHHTWERKQAKKGDKKESQGKRKRGSKRGH